MPLTKVSSGVIAANAVVDSFGTQSITGDKLGLTAINANNIVASVTLTTPIISGNLNLDSTGTTGIRVPAANTLLVHTAGVEAMRITSTGNVAIGTTSPFAKLCVIGSAGVNSIMTETSAFFGQSNGILIGSDGTDGLLGVGNSGTKLSLLSRSDGVYSKALTIDSGGRVTMSAQPCFYAYTYSNTTQGIVKTFDNIETNVGSYYNNTNGRFTAPVAGIYEFRAGYIGVQSSDTVTRLKFFKNGAGALNGDVNTARLDGTASGTELPFGELTIFLNLAASDYITLVVETDSAASLTNLGYAKFCGRLMQ